MGKYSNNVSWRHVESHGYKYRFCLTNWSPLVKAFPRPDFNIAERRVPELKALAQPIIDGSPKAIQIVPWTEGMAHSTAMETSPETSSCSPTTTDLRR
jgi:hypothetical protein